MSQEEIERGVVQMVLRLTGVSKLHIEFDSEARALQATYHQRGTVCSEADVVRTIPFSELEKMFNQGEESSRGLPAEPARPPAAP